MYRDVCAATPDHVYNTSHQSPSHPQIHKLISEICSKTPHALSEKDRNVPRAVLAVTKAIKRVENILLEV